MGNLIMRHKAFVGPPSWWNFRPPNENYETIRERAEAFINTIGAENIVSVTEHALTSSAPFSVVVWYRVDAAG
jgi:hypothetical protein